MEVLRSRMPAMKDKMKSLLTSKQFFVIVVLTAVFVTIGVYYYKNYVKKNIDREYVPNKEFMPGPRPGEIPTVDMYFFYTKWCPYCKKAKPIWKLFKEQIGDKFIKDTKVNFIEVDCEKDTLTADKYDIKGYPTIKLVNGNKVIEYDAKTDIDTLHQFLNTSIS